MNTIYMIKKICIDPSENDPIRAVTEKEIGYCLTKKDAEKVCEEGGIIDEDACWALKGKTSKFKIIPLERLVVNK